MSNPTLQATDRIKPRPPPELSRYRLHRLQIIPERSLPSRPLAAALAIKATMRAVSAIGWIAVGL